MDNNSIIIKQTIDFMENPEPKLEEISENDNGINQLILAKTLFDNEIEHIEQAMENVSPEMLEMWQEQKQFLDINNSKCVSNISVFLSKSINEINDSDVTYSKIMAGIATAGAITALTGILMGNLIPGLKALIPVGTTAFISASITFMGIFVIKPTLGYSTLDYIMTAIKSGIYINEKDLHEYMLTNWCSNEVILNRWEGFITAWASPLCIFFSQDLLKWLFDWFKKKLEETNSNKYNIDNLKFYYLLKTLKSNNSNIKSDYNNLSY